MANVTYDDRDRAVRSPAEQWDDRYEPARLVDAAKSHPGLSVTAIAALGLGALAWYYFGPDLRRYLKLRNM